MNKIISIICLLLFSGFSVSGQLTLKEQRQFDRKYNEAVDHFLKRDIEAGIASFTECIQMDPSAALCYFNRGRLYAAKGDLEAALTDLDRAISYNRDKAEPFFYKGYFMFGNDTTALVDELLRVATEKGFQHAELFYMIGLKALEEGDSDKALVQFDRAIRLDVTHALSYHERAGIKRNLNDFNGALYDYKTAVNYREDFPIAYNNMGSVKMTIGDLEGAIKDFSTAIEQDDQLYRAYNNRGYALLLTEMPDSAKIDFEKAIEIKPDFIPAKLNLSVALSKMGLNDEAVASLDQAIQEHPEAGALFLNRGLIKEQQGDLIGACEDWNQALQLGEAEAEEYISECK